MTDEDMIRRGDALETFMGYDRIGDIKDAIAAIPAVQPSPDVAALVEAISPLVAIADAFDANELDDEARKFWGQHSVNTTPHENIVLYSGRGGKEMLTLADCMKARAILARVKGGA